jgi:leucyl aminopeptidase
VGYDRRAMDVDVAAQPPEGATVCLALAAPSTDLPDQLDALLRSGEITSERGRARLVRVAGEPVIAAGAGPRDAVDADAVRDAAASAVRELRASIGGNLAWRLDGALPLEPHEQVRAAVEGAVIGGYDPGAWKTGDRSHKPVDRLTIVTEDGVAEAVSRAAIVARWTNDARDLANRPANDLTPEQFAASASDVAHRFEHVVADALGPEEMAAKGMGALLGVAAGSHNPPRLISLRYEPPSPARPDLVLGLVGKGLTFDTGGISIKPAAYLENMKGDKAGAAAVVAALGALAEIQLPVRTIGIVAATENMTGGGSYRPGDILTASNGTTIEITNTDAEGRLVLADALVYAREQGATHLLDLATLTGAMDRALGDLYAGVFGNDEGWRDEVVAAGEASGDHAWAWPMHRRYHRLIDSEFADLKNHSIRGQAIPAYAAEFLREFAGDGPWAHIDMAGTGFLTWPRGDYLSQKGGTGYGVRLIVELATRLAAP